MKLKVELKGGPAVEARIKKLSQSMPQITAEAMHASALAILVPLMRQKLIDNKNVFTGELLARTSARAGIADNPYVEVGSFDQPYGVNIEKGSPPHSPDLKKIVRWVQKKMGLTGVSAGLVANQIMKHIESQGTKAYPYVVPTFEANQDRFVRDVVERLKRELGS
jgi:hypothetical protein